MATQGFWRSLSLVESTGMARSTAFQSPRTHNNAFAVMHRRLRIAAYLAVAWCLIVFFYGLATYPDAPYKACNSPTGYCGKGGKLHTESEYQAQQSWERTLSISWPLGILAAIYLGRTRRAVERK